MKFSSSIALTAGAFVAATSSGCANAQHIFQRGDRIVSNNLRSTTADFGQDCWVTVEGPAAAPAPGSACAAINVDAINEAEAWNAQNAYWLTFGTQASAPDNCAVLINPGLTPGEVPAGLASPDGKFYMGPYSVPNIGQAYAVYDKAPTVVNGWTEPENAVGHVKASSVALDSNTIVFKQGAFEKQAPAPAKTVVADTMTRTTKTLYHGDSYCVQHPDPSYYSVAFAVSFSDGTQVSVQRSQNTDGFWAVDSSCSQFNAAKANLGSMAGATCSQYTTEQYGAPIQAGSVWQS